LASAAVAFAIAKSVSAGTPFARRTCADGTMHRNEWCHSKTAREIQTCPTTFAKIQKACTIKMYFYIYMLTHAKNTPWYMKSSTKDIYYYLTKLEIYENLFSHSLTLVFIAADLNGISSPATNSTSMKTHENAQSGGERDLRVKLSLRWPSHLGIRFIRSKGRSEEKTGKKLHGSTAAPQKPFFFSLSNASLSAFPRHSEVRADQQAGEYQVAFGNQW
jgi:hypothetical protein